MIELVIAAVLQIATISADINATPSTEGGSTPAQTTVAVDGGTGNWDDNN